MLCFFLNLFMSLNVKMFLSIHGQGECSFSHIFFLYFFSCKFQDLRFGSHKSFWRKLELGLISFQSLLLQGGIWSNGPQHHGRTRVCNLRLLAIDEGCEHKLISINFSYFWFRFLLYFRFS